MDAVVRVSQALAVISALDFMRVVGSLLQAFGFVFFCGLRALRGETG